MKDLLKEVTLKDEQAITLNINDVMRIRIRRNDIGFSLDVIAIKDDAILDELVIYDDDLELSDDEGRTC